MRRVVLKAAALAWLAAGCANDAPTTNPHEVNDLSLQLTLPSGQQIRVLQYVVSGGPSNVTRRGDVDVEQSSVLRFRVGGLPVGGGYTMQLSAVTSVGAPCSGAAPFAIDDEHETPLEMTLACRGEITNDTDGAGDLDLDVDVVAAQPLRCPVATGISLSPAQAEVGAALAIEGFSSSAADSVSWSASAGSVGDPAAPATSFTCNRAGDVTLTFTVQKTGCANAQVTAVATCGAAGTPVSPAMLTLGANHACQVLPNDGRGICWGNFVGGVLGSGSTAAQPSANFVDATALPQGLESTWKQIAAGLSHSCGISFADDVYCWGLNTSGQLGSSSPATSATPTPVHVSTLPTGTKWAQLSTGSSASTVCGITSRGAGYCWGSNANGQVGNPAALATQTVPLPIDISTLPAGTSWTSLSTAQTHACGITNMGAAYCWGDDGSGKLGNGPNLTVQQNRPSPVDVSTLPAGTRWVSISAAQTHTCGVTASGDAYCWGSDGNGKLGNGAAASSDQDRPVLVSRDLLAAGAGWAQISAGNNHACAVATDGGAYCWGAGNTLGNGSSGQAPSPVPVDLSLLPPGTSWITLQSANTHTCGLTTAGTTYCWGADTQGRLGNGPTITAAQPRPQTPVVRTVGVVAVNRWKLAGAIGDPTNVDLTFSVVPMRLATAGKADAAAATIDVTVQSSNPAVVPAANVAISGTSTQRTAKIQPVGVGTATLTFDVRDALGSQSSFAITYGASGDAAAPAGRYHMGITDASTAIDVGDGYMVVAGDEGQVLYLYKQNESGYPVKSWDFSDPNQLSSNERDIEAAARVGDLIVWTASQGNGRDGSAKEYRRMLFATRISGSGASVDLTFAGRYGGGPLSKDAQAPLGLRNDLLAWDQNNGHGLGADFLGLVAAGAPGVLPNAPGGLNVEGFEFAKNGTTGYLGFRAPTINVGGAQMALLVPITNVLELVNGIPAQQSGLTRFGAPIFLNLGGRSIREIRRNDMAQYLIIAGPPDNPTVGVNDTWALYTWDGDTSHDAALNQLLPDANYLTGGAWEAIASVPSPLAPGASARLVTDSGDTLWFGTTSLIDYAKWYSEPVTLR